MLEATDHAARFAVDYNNKARDQFERRLLIIEGEPFRRTFFAARSQEASALPAEIPNHVYTICALMEVCQQQKERVIREVRLETVPIVQVKYLSTLSESCRALEHPFTVTVRGLGESCRAPEEQRPDCINVADCSLSHINNNSLLSCFRV